MTTLEEDNKARAAVKWPTNYICYANGCSFNSTEERKAIDHVLETGHCIHLQKCIEQYHEMRGDEVAMDRL